MREHGSLGEVVGTFWLVFGGCATAVLGAKFVESGVSLGVGFAGTALAFGLAVMTGAYALLWMFWVAPLLGGILGAYLYRAVHGPDIDEEIVDATRAVPVHEPA